MRPGDVGVTVNRTIPFEYASEVQFETGALEVFRYTVMSAATRPEAPSPPKKTFCACAGVPIVSPGEISALTTLTLLGIGALKVAVVPPSVSCNVPVDALAVGV